MDNIYTEPREILNLASEIICATLLIIFIVGAFLVAGIFHYPTY